MTQTWKNSKQRGTALLLMLALADSANEEDFTCWPSIRTLANKIRMSDRSVQILLAQLVKAGEIAIVGKTEWGTHIYKVKPPTKPVQPKYPKTLRATRGSGEDESPVGD
jgi:hypothetical protein